MHGICKMSLTVGIVENHVVVQFGSASGRQLEDFQGTGSRHDGIGGRHGRNDVLNNPLGQTIRDSQNSWREKKPRESLESINQHTAAHRVYVEKYISNNKRKINQLFFYFSCRLKNKKMEPHENCKIKFQNNITLERLCGIVKTGKKRKRIGGDLSGLYYIPYSLALCRAFS